MTSADLVALVKGFAPAVRDYVASALRPHLERIVALEAREAVPGPEGPAGKDGAAGRDGILEPGVKFVQIDERTAHWVRADGSVLGEWKSSDTIYRGIWRQGDPYEKGDAVTYAGSFWIARAATTEKPGDGATAWQLAAKCGRDGKDGKPGPKGDKGDPGASR